MSISFQTLKAQLAADRKKSAILGGLFLVLVVAVGRLFVGGSDNIPPAVAVAVAVAPPATTSAASPEPVLTRPVSETPIEPPPALEPTSKSDPVRPRMTASRRVDVEGMPREPMRDLFSTPAWDQFPKTVGLEALMATKATEKKGPSFLEALQKQISSYREAQRVESAKFDAELVGLELQSTMTGEIRSAYISGRLVHEGDHIDGFVVVKIKDGSVCLGKNGAIGKIKMR